MTVKKLIQVLSTFNLNAEVQIPNYREGRKPGQTLPVSFIDIVEDASLPHIGFASAMFKPKSRKQSKRIIIL